MAKQSRMYPYSGRGAWTRNDRSDEAASTALHAVLIGSLVFVASLIISPWYYLGDQFHYRGFYNSIGRIDLHSLLELQLTKLGTAEPVYAITTYFASQILDKDLFFSLVNGGLAFLAATVLRRAGARWTVIYLLLLANYYAYVLYFAAERFKLALFFFLLAMALPGYARLAAGLASVLAHAQMIALFASQLAEKASESDKIIQSILRPNGKRILLAAIMLAGGTLAVISLWPHISTKLQGISIKDTDLFKAFAFLAGTVIVTRSPVRSIAAFLPFLVLIPVVGGDRLNIFCFFVYIWLTAPHRNRMEIITYAFLAYFALTGITFLSDAYDYGQSYFN